MRSTATPISDHAVTSVRPGADRLLSDVPQVIRGRTIGVLTNHTGCLSDGTSLIDAIIHSGIARIGAVFGPEHGVTGDIPDGSSVGNTVHGKYGFPIYSLYGKTHKPTPEMLKGIDVLVCDIQDVGARFYTFISTVALALEAAAELEIPCIILDRPNPIRGLSFDGPVRDMQLRSFVGWMPIPVTHGMTIGELARMWNGEGWMKNGVKASLEVIALEGWRRSMWYDQTLLPWIPPSPNMPRLSTATIYPGMCFIEGTSIAEGRGTDSPFELVGAPWASPARIIDVLESYAIPGVGFSAEDFLPREIPGVASNPKYLGRTCRGIRVVVNDRDRIEPVKLGVSVLSAFGKVHQKETELRYRRFDILTGSKEVRKMLLSGVHPDEISQTWVGGLTYFGEIRKRYLLYDGTGVGVAMKDTP